LDEELLRDQNGIYIQIEDSIEWSEDEESDVEAIDM